MNRIDRVDVLTIPRFAPTKHRARMMATLFFMQPLGQIAGNVVSLVVIAATRSRGDALDHVDLVRNTDSMWRWVLGCGVVPGVIAILFRFAIPESPRYLLDIEDDPVTAEFDATTLFSERPPSPGLESGSWATGSNMSNIQLPPPAGSNPSPLFEEEENPVYPYGSLVPATLNSHWRRARSDIWRYFWTEGNWRSLAGTSIAWLLVDFGFYGIGLSSPQGLAQTWGALNINGSAPYWKTNDQPDYSVYQMFMDTSVRGLVTLNIGSFVGGLLLIVLAHRLDRVALQKYMFLALAALFVTLGSLFINYYQIPPVVITLYVLGQMLFNLGMLRANNSRDN